MPLFMPKNTPPDTLRPAKGTHQELELKLALPASRPDQLLAQLARTPVLARRHATHLRLHNTYYDTPDQALRQQRIALRIRRLELNGQAQWLQTLKTAPRNDSALSLRGEWETPLPAPTLDWQALQNTPWPHIDPEGTLFASLAPCFVTAFERTVWQVRRRDGSAVEVALDIGHILSGGHTAPLCELELELKAGPPQALFEVAAQIARTLAVLPISASKAERGYALAAGTLHAPRWAQPVPLRPRLPLPEAARRVLHEAFHQFTHNLQALRSANDPELTHQARIGWRRLHTALRLFKSVLTPPSWQPLEPMLAFLGELRDLEVALNDTLPPLANAYAGGQAQREQAWQAMVQALQAAAQLQRKALRYALDQPALGAALLATTQWLEADTLCTPAPRRQLPPLRAWAKHRITRLRARWLRALKLSQQTNDPQSQHRSRLLAKRLRYSMEALHKLLPRQQRAQRWQQQALQFQTRIGSQRDMERAVVLVSGLDISPSLVDFLRGVALGMKPPEARSPPKG